MHVEGRKSGVITKSIRVKWRDGTIEKGHSFRTMAEAEAKFDNLIHLALTTISNLADIRIDVTISWVPNS